MSGCSDDYVQAVAAQWDPGDGYVQSHVDELTERDDYVTIHRDGGPGPAEHYNNWHLADENANDMQEVYGLLMPVSSASFPLLRRSKRSRC